MRPAPRPDTNPAPTSPPPFGATVDGITWRDGKPAGLEPPIKVKGGLSKLIVAGRR